MSKQEYRVEGLGYVELIGDVPGMDGYVVVNTGGDYTELEVIRKSDLRKKEDTYQWKRGLQEKAELERIVAVAKTQLDSIVEEVKKRAVTELSSRMKLSVLLGSTDGNARAIALAVSDELEKLIDKKSEGAVKDASNPFN